MNKSKSASVNIEKRNTEQYLLLLKERERLLLTSNEKNRIIKSLDVQLENMEKAMSQDLGAIPFAKVDEVPVFPGCENEDDQRACFQKSMQRHIGKNFRYPEDAQKQGIQGRVAIMFTMNTKGDIANVKVRGPHKVLEDEAARIISRLPKLKPGVHEGKKVDVIYSIPITFKLTDGLDSNVTSDSKAYDSKTDVPFAVVDEAPVFPGCEDASNKRACFNEKMQQHIGKNFKYPLEAQEKGIQGRVSIMFTVSKDGSIQKVRMRGPDKLLEKEAARIIALLPKMTPGKQKGKAVNVPFSIPISFKLNKDNFLDNGIQLSRDHGANRAYIIDGVESTKAEYEAIGEENVESLYILNKDASIKRYGQRGKNGVIEVKTKKKD